MMYNNILKRYARQHTWQGWSVGQKFNLWRYIIMTLVILAAGMGSRFGGVKQMEPIDKDGNFSIDYSVFDAKRAGFNKVVFIIKEAIAEDFKATIGARVEKHIDVEYAYQELSDIPAGYTVPEGRTKPWGTTHAVRSTRNIVKEPYGVINADDFYGRNTYEKLAAHLSKIEKGEMPNDGVSHCCAVGFKVKNTLTDKGGCSRGICKVGEDGMLQDLVETHKIEKAGDNARYPDANGNMIDLDGETVVSMNCWGLTPDTLDMLDRDFDLFMQNLDKAADPLKAESLLPAAIDTFVKEGKCDVRVYPTESEWYGVTFKEDKPWVVESIQALIDAGEYPEHLWG